MSEPRSDDLELLRQLAKGNEVAFEALYARYQGPIYRFALHMSGNGALAEDVTQEVFMAIITNPKAYDPAHGSVAGYLFGIARNVTRRNLAQRYHDISLDAQFPENEGLDPADDLNLLAELSTAQSLECLRKAVLALPEEYREVVVLCGLEEMTYPDAAEILRCPPGTIASRLNRAKAMLRSKLTAQGCAR